MDPWGLNLTPHMTDVGHPGPWPMRWDTGAATHPAGRWGITSVRCSTGPLAGRHVCVCVCVCVCLCVCVCVCMRVNFIVLALRE